MVQSYPHQEYYHIFMCRETSDLRHIYFLVVVCGLSTKEDFKKMKVSRGVGGNWFISVFIYISL